MLSSSSSTWLTVGSRGLSHHRSVFSILAANPSYLPLHLSLLPYSTSMSSILTTIHSRIRQPPLARISVSLSAFFHSAHVASHKQHGHHSGILTSHQSPTARHLPNTPPAPRSLRTIYLQPSHCIPKFATASLLSPSRFASSTSIAYCLFHTTASQTKYRPIAPICAPKAAETPAAAPAEM